MNNNQFEGIDIGKVKALNEAGWESGEIAAEVGASSNDVEEALAYIKLNPDPEKEETQRPVLIVLSEDEVKNLCERAASIGAREAMKKLDSERKKEITKRADRRLYNTKLLLRNYRALKEYADNAIFSRDQMKVSAMEMLEAFMQGEDTDAKIESIRRSTERTVIMIDHIDSMIGIYEAFCEKSKDKNLEYRRYEVMKDMYISEPELSAEEIAQKQNMSTQNVYKDLRMAIERLSALIFGVDGMTYRTNPRGEKE